MASKKRSGWVKGLIIGSIVCFVILVLLAVWFFFFRFQLDGEFLDLDLHFGPRGFEHALVFVCQYTAYVLGQDVTRAEIEEWYSPEAPRPELGRVGDSLRFLPDGEPSIEGIPFQSVVVSQNIADELSAEYFSEEVGIWRRDSAPGDDPVFTLLFLDIEDEAAAGPSIELRHEPDLEKEEVLLVFELQGREPDAGTLKRERHRVTLVEKPEDGEEWPPFLVTSHVVEPLPPEPAEAPGE